MNLGELTGQLADGLAALCLLGGVALTLVAGIGLLRFPDALTRMHAQSKPSALGLLLVMVGTALALRSWAMLGPLLLVATFQILTAPVGAHMLSRAVAVGTREQNPYSSEQ